MNVVMLNNLWYTFKDDHIVMLIELFIRSRTSSRFPVRPSSDSDKKSPGDDFGLPLSRI